MPWVLLAVIIAFTQVPYWSMFAISRIADDLVEPLLLPVSIELGLKVGYTIVLASVVIWTASAVGSEFGWGTFRSVLARGPERWRFLTSLFLLMVAMGAAWLLALTVAIGISSLIVGLIEGGSRVATHGEWAGSLVQLGKSAAALVPYIAVAMFFAVLTTSAGTASAITLVYKFLVEDVLVPIVILTTDRSDAVSEYVLGRAVKGWLAHAGDDGGLEGVLTIGGSLGPLPGNIHGLLVMLAYTAVLGAATIWVFQRRDIGGAKGP